MIESCREAAQRELLIAERTYLIANGWEQPDPKVDSWIPPAGLNWARDSYAFNHAVNRQRFDDRGKRWKK